MHQLKDKNAHIQTHTNMHIYSQILRKHLSHFLPAEFKLRVLRQNDPPRSMEQIEQLLYVLYLQNISIVGKDKLTHMLELYVVLFLIILESPLTY